jgi:mxaC protein
MFSVEFEVPQVLALLPLVLLPLLRRHPDLLNYAWIEWLPDDPIGRLAHRGWQWLAVFTIAFIIVGLAKPIQSETRIERIGRGAEISILMDRSSSMDAAIRRNAPKLGEQAQPTRSKNDLARKALSWLLHQRPQNRHALTLFNTAAIRVAPFSDDVAIVQAGLDASDIGRGVNKTNMGLGLLAAIAEFDGRSYSGSRVILLVSDGGARLDAKMRELIRQGLQRNRISLYFIYIQSDPNSPNLALVGTDADASREEVALHVFFESLGIEYRVFQAEDPESMTAAVAQIDQLQNLPLIYYQSVPRIDYSRACFIVALGGCIFLAGLAATRLERLT